MIAVENNEATRQSHSVLHEIDLATHEQVVELPLGYASVLGVGARGPLWIHNEGVLEARDACTGALLADEHALRARYPELGRSIVWTYYDAAGGGVWVMNERAEVFLIDPTLQVSRTNRKVEEVSRPAWNWVRWPDGEIWSTSGTHLTNHAHEIVSPLLVFDAEILHDDSSSVFLDDASSIVVAYHKDLVDQTRFISRIARTGEVLWTKTAASLATADDLAQMRPWTSDRIYPVHAEARLGLIFTVVFSNVVAIDAKTGNVRWRLPLEL